MLSVLNLNWLYYYFLGRAYENGTSCHICSMRLKRTLSEYNWVNHTVQSSASEWNMGLSLFMNWFIKNSLSPKFSRWVRKPNAESLFVKKALKCNNDILIWDFTLTPVCASWNQRRCYIISVVAFLTNIGTLDLELRTTPVRFTQADDTNTQWIPFTSSKYGQCFTMRPPLGKRLRTTMKDSTLMLKLQPGSYTVMVHDPRVLPIR